jgi:peroxiredoxin Q/BCP
MTRFFTCTAGRVSAASSFALLVAVAPLGASAQAPAPPPAAKPGEPAPAPGAGAKPPAPEPALLAVGAPAPDFSSEAHTGEKVVLSKLKGKYVVLYWYPKDDTPGCTKEACDFRDNWARLQKSGVAVFGISTQDNASHKAFAEKHKLPFPLLPDEKGDIAKKSGVPVVDGKARRITYLIGKDGKVKHVWPKVTPVGHAGEILAQIEAK